MPANALPFIILNALLFGSTLVASRFSVGQYAPTTYISFRLLLAGAAHLLAYGTIRRGQWPRDGVVWRRGALLGFFGTAVPLVSIVSSLQYQSSGITSLLLTLNPAVTVLLAHFFLKEERLTGLRTMGVVLAFAGALLLAARGESGLPDVERANPLGYALVIGAVLSGSSMTIYARRRMQTFDAFDVASIRMFSATLFVAPLAYFLVGFDFSGVNSAGYGALFYAALIGTFGGFLVNFYNIKRFGATAAAVTSYVIPIVAGIGGALLLDETITGVMVVGMVLIIGGVALLNRHA